MTNCVPWPYTWICEMYMGRSLHIYIEHWILKFEKHLTTSKFRYEPFYYLWVQRLFNIRREAQSFYSGFFIYPPAPTRVAHATKVSASKRMSTVSFGIQFSTHWLFRNLPKSSARFRCVTSHALCNPVSHLELLWHLSVTRPLCALVNTCFNVAPN